MYLYWFVLDLCRFVWDLYFICIDLYWFCIDLYWFVLICIAFVSHWYCTLYCICIAFVTCYCFCIACVLLLYGIFIDLYWFVLDLLYWLVLHLMGFVTYMLSDLYGFVFDLQAASPFPLHPFPPPRPPHPFALCLLHRHWNTPWTPSLWNKPTWSTGCECHRRMQVTSCSTRCCRTARPL